MILGASSDESTDPPPLNPTPSYRHFGQRLQAGFVVPKIDEAIVPGERLVE